jgi:hypothetical protein
MPAITCQYGNCLEPVGDLGVTVSLKTATYDGEKRAVFCCAAHAAASLSKLADDRGEDWVATPLEWRTT